MSKEEKPNVLILVSDKARQYIKIEAAKSRMSMIHFVDTLCANNKTNKAGPTREELAKDKPTR